MSHAENAVRSSHMLHSTQNVNMALMCCYWLPTANANGTPHTNLQPQK